MRPLGSPGTRKLKDILIDRKIPRAFRDFTPVVAAGGDILWIPGVCVSEYASVTPSTVKATRLEWEREDCIPWKKER